MIGGVQDVESCGDEDGELACVELDYVIPLLSRAYLNTSTIDFIKESDFYNQL